MCVCVDEGGWVGECEYAFREPTDLSVTEGVLAGVQTDELQCMSELIVVINDGDEVNGDENVW